MKARVRHFVSSVEIFGKYRHLLKYLVERDFKVKYRRSVLGILWSALNPLLMMMVMYVVFSTIFNREGLAGGLPLVRSTGLPPDFLVYLLTGQLIVSFFNDSTSTAMGSVFGNAGLIKKVYIPKYIFPLQKIIFSGVNLLFSMAALLLVILFTGSPLSWWALLFPLPILLLTLFNLGVGLILSSLVVFFRDIQHLYSIFTAMLAYLTPVFYSESMIDKPWALLLLRMNPLYWFLSMFRQFMVYGAPPTIAQCVITCSCTVVVLVLGLYIFKKTQDNFILYI